MTLFSIQNLHILDSAAIRLDLCRGDCLAITGPSGSGKSLFLRALADLDPHDGEIRLEGKPLESYAPWQWRRQVGYLPAESSWWLARVADHFPGQAVHLYQQLAEVGLSADIIKSPPHRLSSGERQRLSLLRLLQNQPRVLLLDEPTANLDHQSSALVERLLQTYRSTHGCVLLWVSHDREQAARVANRHLHFSRQGVWVEQTATGGT
ncbi:MAG: ATP-binding protein [Desulfobulbaceae bacterium]|nr:MAG: ATP-binding protein [Desulfobulbaceae bacterium]